jgi:PAS domain S-box-containing protein
MMETASNRLAWFNADLNSLFGKVILVGFVAALSYFAAGLGSFLILRPENISPLWPGCALLTAVLLLVPRKLWPILIAITLASFALYDLQAGVPVGLVLRLILADATEVITAALLVSYAFDGIPRLDSVEALAKYSFFAVILAPLVVSFLGAFAWHDIYWTSWRVSFFSEAIAFLTIPPAIFGWAAKGPAWARKSRAYYVEAVVLIAALTSLGFLAFIEPGGRNREVLLYSLVPFLLWAALRFGSVGASTSMIAISFLSIWGTVHGRGPFTRQAPIDNVLSLQLFLLIATAPFMVLAVLVEAQKNSEQALKKSEDKFSIAFRECPSALALTRLKDDQYLEVNETFARLTGYARDEIIGRTPDELNLWVDPLQRIELLKRLREEGSFHNVEARFHMRNGGIRIGLASAELIEIDGEQCLLALISDITEVKQAQDVRLKHAAIVEATDDAIFSKDLNGTILSWNAGAHRIFGFTETEAVGQPIAIIVPPELHDEEIKLLQRLRAGERVEHYETIRVTREGKRLDMSLTMSPLRDSTGRITGISNISRDITDRKRAEQELRESEERFRLVADTAPVLIWLAGADKLCSFFNKGWLDFTGRTLEQEQGNGWASGVHPEDLERCLGIYSDAFDARVDFEMEYRLKRYDGKYRWIVDFGVPRFEADGTFCGYIGSCVDITDRRSSEKALEELSGRLLVAQEEERTRIARELHDDFSQRLALQCIGLEQLWKKLPKSMVEERINIKELLKTTQEMSSDMHSLSHQLHSSKLEYAGLLPTLRGLCQEISQKYGVQVEFVSPDTIPVIQKDTALCLFRVCQEALGNVVKHSQVKEAKVQIFATKDEIDLEILDNGRGFDPEVHDTCSGIGLISMIERLRLVGGALRIQTSPGQGTRISAQAPITASSHEAEKKSAAARG